MFDSLPPATDVEITKDLREYCESLLFLNKKYRDEIEKQNSLIKEMDNFIKANIDNGDSINELVICTVCGKYECKKPNHIAPATEEQCGRY